MVNTTTDKVGDKVQKSDFGHLSNKPNQLKLDLFSLRNTKHIQDTRKEVLKSIGILSPWERLRNYPKKIISKRAAQKEEKRKAQELQKKKIRQDVPLNEKAKLSIGTKKDREQESVEKEDQSKQIKPVLKAGTHQAKDVAADKTQQKKEELKAKKVEAEKRKEKELDFLKAKETELKKVKWTSPDILKTNLVKENAVVFINWRKNISLLLLGVFLSIAIVGVAHQSVAIENREIKEAEEILLGKINKINKKIELAKNNIKEVMILQNKLILIESLLDKHVYWTNFFKFLEDTTIEDVYYSGFSGTTNGTYVLLASAESFNMLAKQIAGFRANEKVVFVRTDGGSVGAVDGEGSRVSFSLELKINPEIFYR